MKKTGWIIGIVLSSIAIIFLLLLIIVGITDSSNVKVNDDNLSDVEAMALTRRASELFCAGIYYTDKVFSINPQSTSYDEWKGYADKADKYWDALNNVLETMENEIDDETFKDMLQKQDTRKTNPFVTTAYALDSAEIIKVFDSAPAGKRLKTLAKHLGKDMKYAQQALKMANGEITAQSWNDFGDTAQKLETGARGLKTVATTAAFVAGGPTLSATLSGAATVVGGASLVMQIADDGCFVMMGDKYDSSEFVANLQKASDYVAPVAFTAGILTMDFSKADSAVLAGYDIAENFRGLFQKGKIAGVQFGQNNCKMTSMTLAKLEQYKKAKEDGQSLSDDIIKLLDMLDKLETIPTPQPTLTPIPTLNATPEITLEPTDEPSISNGEMPMLYGEFFDEYTGMKKDLYWSMTVYFDGNGNFEFNMYRQEGNQKVVVEGSESNYDKTYTGKYVIKETSSENPVKFVITLYYVDENGIDAEYLFYVYYNDIYGNKIVSLFDEQYVLK